MNVARMTRLTSVRDRHRTIPIHQSVPAAFGRGCRHTHPPGRGCARRQRCISAACWRSQSAAECSEPAPRPGRDVGAVEVAPAGSTFTDPVTGLKTDVGTQVDVHPSGKPGYRDFTVFLADQDPRIGQNQMPYPDDVDGPAAVNYATAALSKGRRPFTDAGMWGLQRVLVPSPGSCPLKALAPGVCP